MPGGESPPHIVTFTLTWSPAMTYHVFPRLPVIAFAIAAGFFLSFVIAWSL